MLIRTVESALRGKRASPEPPCVGAKREDYPPVSLEAAA